MGGGGYRGGYAGARSYGGGRGGYGYSNYYQYRSNYYRYPRGYYRYYGWGYPWWSFGWGYGGYGGVSYPAYYSYPVETAPAYAAPASDATLYITLQQQQEIDRLKEEVETLRAEQAAGARQAGVPQAHAARQIQADTVLVYRNHRTEEIQNYAVVGKTLWVFTEQRSRKIPISELDVAATTKANEDRGIDFLLPR